MDIAYKLFRADLKTFMDATIVDHTSTTFREIIGVRDIRKAAPASMFNGGYVIQWDGVREVDQKPMIAGYVYYLFSVKVQVGFILNQNESNATTEMAAINDIETIMKMRINDSTYPTDCQHIKAEEATPFEFIDASFAISEITFLVQYRVTL